MADNIFFTSADHKNRLVDAIERFEKVEKDGKADPWYAAAFYILSADLYTWNNVGPYISRSGIKFDKILEKIHFSSGELTLIETAANLFRDHGQVDLSRFSNLDENNFSLVIDAIKIRRYSLQVSDFSTSSVERTAEGDESVYGDDVDDNSEARELFEAENDISTQ